MITVKVAEPSSTIQIIKPDHVEINADGEVILQDSTGYKQYEGSYEVESKFNEQVLQTEKRKLEQDIKVKAMYISEVSNEAGGTTISFG